MSLSFSAAVLTLDFACKLLTYKNFNYLPADGEFNFLPGSLPESRKVDEEQNNELEFLQSAGEAEEVRVQGEKYQPDMCSENDNSNCLQLLFVPG